MSDEAYPLIIEGRKIILDWSRENPEFLTSLSPLPLKTLLESGQDMLHAGQLVEVGPMAAVAGAMAEFVGRGLLKHSPGGVVVENGGDIFLAARIPVRIGLFAGKSVLSMKLGLKVDPEDMPLGFAPRPAQWGIPTVWAGPTRPPWPRITRPWPMPRHGTGQPHPHGQGYRTGLEMGPFH